jgi:hypothetical protein
VKSEKRSSVVQKKPIGFRTKKLSWMEPLEARRLLSVNVLTGHNDAGRTGLNASELTLTQANVNTSTFGALFSYPVQGQMYAQPLYVSNLAIPGKGTRNVVFVATENNDVYAFDANSTSGAGAGVLWHVNLGLAAATPNSFFANRYGPYHDINPQVGITSTPVIDLATNTMYLDAFTNDVAGQNSYSHHIHALDLTTGADKVTPMLVTAAVKGNGIGGDGTTIPFVATQQLQRPALSLLNGVLYVAYSGYADTDPYHGWILGFNSSTLGLMSVLNTTPNTLAGSGHPGEGGIWQTGAGLASDGTNMFLLVGNGDFSAAIGDYGDSMLKVAPDPTSTVSQPNVSGYGLKVADYFTPYNQQSLADADADLGSAGGIVLPDQPGSFPHEFIGSGKQGVVYLVNRDNMGKFNAATDQVIQTITLGHGNFDTPAYFNHTIYYHAVGDVLKAFVMTNGLLPAAPSAQGLYSYGGQGATPSISANGTANGVVWDIQFDGTHEVLHAYNPTTLAELYNSNQNVPRDQMGAGVKFIVPTVADGEVFVGGANKLTIFGLVAPPTTAPVAPSALAATALSASTINLTWIDNSDNEAGFKIERSTDNVNFTQIGIANANTTSYLDSTLLANTLYYYRVRATNIIGDSPFTATVSATTPASTGAINVYHFDAGSGVIAVDSVSGKNGTLIGVPLPKWVSPARIGSNALLFSGDGVDLQTKVESSVQTSNLAPILGSTSTFDVWVKTTQVGGTIHYKSPAITGAEQAGGANDINWGTLDSTGHIGLYVGDTGGVYSTNPINDGQWHNVAMTRNASTGTIQIYADGVLNNTGTFDTGSKTSSFSLIGALSEVANNGTTFNGANYFNGALDEVRIYNQVLGASEISSLGTIPGAPTLVTATAASGTVVHLTWTTPSNFTQNIEIDRKIGASGTYAPIATIAGSITTFDDTNLTAGTQYFYVVKAIDAAGTSPASNELSVTPPVPTIIANRVFYNGSSYDGQNGSSNPTDRLAIATDKLALMPGQVAKFENYTSYYHGLNGIIIDVANLDNLPRFEDFTFKVGNDNNPAGWAVAPVPTYVNAYPGRGPGGSTQITVIWDDHAIQNEWLQVDLLANPHTNLGADDVFYFGNLIGDTGNDPSAANVTISDIAKTKSLNGTSADIKSAVDFNRDGTISISDIAIAKAYNGNSLPLISTPLPPLASPLAANVAPPAASAFASPAITPTTSEPLLTQAVKAAAGAARLSGASVSHRVIAAKQGSNVSVPPTASTIFPAFVSVAAQHKKAQEALPLRSAVSVLGA